MMLLGAASPLLILSLLTSPPGTAVDDEPRCPVKSELVGVPLVCVRSKFELYRMSAIHRETDEEGITVPFFGNRSCPMSGDPVLPEAFFEHEGQRVYFCCAKCATDGSRRAAYWYERAYPIPTRTLACACDEPEGAVRRKRFQTRWVELCGEACEARFQANPGLFVTQLEYPAARPVTGKPCPVTHRSAASDVFLLFDDEILFFADWPAASQFLSDPERYGP